MSSNSTTQTDDQSWSIDFSDPWTITAVVLLGLLSLASLVRLYQNCVPKTKRVPPTVQVNRIQPSVSNKSSTVVHHKTRAQMRV